MTEHTARLQLAQHTVTELVTQAEQSGLLRRDASRGDRRVSHLRLTPKRDRLLNASLGDLAEDLRALRAMIAGIGSFGDSAAHWIRAT